MVGDADANDDDDGMGEEKLVWFIIQWTQVSTDCEKWKKYDEKCISQSQIKMLIKIYRFCCASTALQPITELM